MKKNITWIISILFIFLLVFGSYFKLKNRNILSKQINSGMFAIMLEKEKGTGKYDYAKDNKWPQSDEYVINMYKTYCEKGSVLRWNNKTKKINATVKGTDNCYVYFDLSEYGNEEHPYLIQTIEDLVRLSNDVNNGTTYAGKYFLLTNDLDFQDEADYENANRTDFKDINGINGDEALIAELTTGSGFIPIGKDSANSFQGTFDGNNKTINNLYINNNLNINIGLFGFVNNLVIYNLTLDGLISNSKKDIKIGSVVGSGNNIKATNVQSKVIIESNGDNNIIGGLIGNASGKITFNKVSNEEKIIGGTNVGGIIGSTNDNDEIKLYEVYNKNVISCTNITNYQPNIGGLIGYANGSIIIDNSGNEGNIDVDTKNEVNLRMGGIVGNVSTNLKLIKLTNVYNKGNLSNLKDSYPESYSNFNNGGNNVLFIGGLIGNGYGGINNYSTIVIIKSYNTGNIKGGNYVSGLVEGTGEKLIVGSSYNTGNIYNGPDTGVWADSLAGLVDTGGDKKVIILNSFNKGNLYGGRSGERNYDYTAGLITTNYYTNVSIINSYNVGNIEDSNYSRSGIMVNYGNNDDVERRNSKTIYFNNIYNGNTAMNNGSAIINWLGVYEYEIKNTYYNSESSRNSYEGILPKSLNEIKTQEFVETLNSNIINETTLKNGDNGKTVSLEEIDPSLKDYKLSKWTLGKDGYPTLVNE